MTWAGQDFGNKQCHDFGKKTLFVCFQFDSAGPPSCSSCRGRERGAGADRRPQPQHLSFYIGVKSFEAPLGPRSGGVWGLLGPRPSSSPPRRAPTRPPRPFVGALLWAGCHDPPPSPPPHTPPHICSFSSFPASRLCRRCADGAPLPCHQVLQRGARDLVFARGAGIRGPAEGRAPGGVLNIVKLARASSVLHITLNWGARIDY